MHRFVIAALLGASVAQAGCFADRAIKESSQFERDGGCDGSDRCGDSAGDGGDGAAAGGGRGGAGSGGRAGSAGDGGAGKQSMPSGGAGRGGTGASMPIAGGGGSGGSGADKSIAGAGASGAGTGMPAAGAGAGGAGTGMPMAGAGAGMPMAGAGAGMPMAGAGAGMPMSGAGASGAGSGGSAAGGGGTGGDAPLPACVDLIEVTDIMAMKTPPPGAWEASEETRTDGNSFLHYVCIGEHGPGKAIFGYGCYMADGDAPIEQLSNLSIVVAPPSCLDWRAHTSSQPLPADAVRFNGTAVCRAIANDAPTTIPNVRSSGVHVGQVELSGGEAICRFEIYQRVRPANDYELLVVP